MTEVDVSAETAGRIATFLDRHHVVSLATCGPDGPHAANVFYARDGFALVWVSDPRSRHSRNLKRDAQIAATVAPDCFELEDVRGVQVFGYAHAVPDPSDRARALRLIAARYPCVAQLARAPSGLCEEYATIEAYRLEPERIVLIDNSRGFGHKDTLRVGPGASVYAR
jgi:uncharacterized protein YhbP (UPF0306 family)